MHRQQLKNPPLSTLRGLLVVAALVAAVFLDSLLAQLVTAVISELVAAILFWGIGVLIALWTMRRYVLGYSYSLSSTMLRVAHLYGRHERPLADVYLNSVAFSGTPDAVRQRYPNARIQRAVLPRNPAELFAIAYRDGERTVILHLQPDEVVEEALESAGKKRR